MNHMLKHDQRRAQEFFAKCRDLAEYLDEYPEARQKELLDDLCKLGCYLSYREQGIPDWLAFPQAVRRAWGARYTDRAFGDHARQKMNAMHPYFRDRIVAIARKAGINTEGKYYLSGLGRYDDPRAWVSTASDVLETARRDNLTVRGAVRHQAVPRGEPESGPVIAQDIEQSLVREYLQRDPALRAKVLRRPKKEMPKLREQIRATHGKKRT
jgi:hypothetical protein